jgi:hypothetical protein
MEKGKFFFDDQEIADLQKELYKKETLRQLREMSREQLDVVYDELQVKLGEVIINADYLEKLFSKELEKLEKNYNLLNEFIDDYMTPVYLEEHGVDIRYESDGDNEVNNGEI